MRKFGIVHSRYWSWAMENGLNDSTKVIGAYLLSCDHGNSIGCFKCPIAYVSDDLGNPSQTVSKGFQKLFETGFLVFCKPSRYVFLPKYLKWNPLKNPNQVKGALDIIGILPSSFTNTHKVLESIKELTLDKYFTDENLIYFETLSKPFRNPSETLSKPFRTIETETDTEKETETDTEKGTLSEPEKSLKDYLKEKIIEHNFIEIKDKIFEFFTWRMTKKIKGKKQQYESEKGIDGLFRNMNSCRESGMIVSDCLDICMERPWLTPDPSYFKTPPNTKKQMTGGELWLQQRKERENAGQ